MEESKKKKVVWWLEAIRIVVATIAGLLGGGALNTLI